MPRETSRFFLTAVGKIDIISSSFSGLAAGCQEVLHLNHMHTTCWPSFMQLVLVWREGNKMCLFPRDWLVPNQLILYRSGSQYISPHLCLGVWVFFFVLCTRQSRKWFSGYVSHKQDCWDCCKGCGAATAMILHCHLYKRTASLPQCSPSAATAGLQSWTRPFKAEGSSLSLLSASTWFHLVLQKNLQLFVGCVGKRNKSSAAESHAERGRHMTKASSKVVPIKGKCCKLMGRQEMPTQFAPVYCHFIQKIVPTPRVWMLTHLLRVRCWLLGWVLGKQQWGCEE